MDQTFVVRFFRVGTLEEARTFPSLEAAGAFARVLVGEQPAIFTSFFGRMHALSADGAWAVRLEGGRNALGDLFPALRETV